jgi:hypothetical protein
VDCNRGCESYRDSLQVGEHVALKKVNQINMRVGGDDALGLGLAFDGECDEEVDRSVFALPIVVVGDVRGHQRVDLRIAQLRRCLLEVNAHCIDQAACRTATCVRHTLKCTYRLQLVCLL